MLKVKASQSTFTCFRSPAVSSSYIWRPAVLLLCINVLIPMFLRHVHLLNHWATWSHWRQHMRKIKHKRLELWLTSRWKHVETQREAEVSESLEVRVHQFVMFLGSDVWWKNRIHCGVHVWLRAALKCVPMFRVYFCLKATRNATSEKQFMKICAKSRLMMLKSLRGVWVESSLEPFDLPASSQ